MATISSLLADHAMLQLRSVVGLLFQGYVPRLETKFQLIRFLLDRWFAASSPAVLVRIGCEYMNAFERVIVEREIPVECFHKGAVKEDIAKPIPASITTAATNRPSECVSDVSIPDDRDGL